MKLLHFSYLNSVLQLFLLLTNCKHFHFVYKVAGILMENASTQVI